MNKNAFTLIDFYYYTINLDEDLKLIRLAVRTKERTKLKFLDNGEIVDISLIDNFFGVYQKAKINEREYMIDSLFDLLYQKHNEDKIVNDLKVSLRVVS